MEEQKYPFEISEHYVPSLNSLRRIYTQHSKFNGNCLLIYELLFDYWNPNYGYAFPTAWTLARDSGLGEATVKRAISTLVELELIEKRKSAVAGNNIYTFKKPVASLEALFAKFPEEKEKHDKRIRELAIREETSKSRWSGSARKIEVLPDRDVVNF